MGRLARMMLAGAMLLAPAGPALASTSLLGPGYANWFYACGEGRPMNLAIRHTDGTRTLFTLGPGARTRTWVRRGDVEAWRCGGPVARNALSLYIVTVP
jgi:hypothetical protein